MIYESSVAALSQMFAVLVLTAIAYAFYFVWHRKSPKVSYFKFVGIQEFKGQIDRTYFFILLGVVIYGILSTLIHFNFSENFHAILISDNSPYGKILKTTTGVSAFICGLIYCFIQASASEELLFRGLIAKRLYSALGRVRGNIVQSFLFWLMHLFIFRLITGSWISYMQLTALITSFGLGLALGFVNYRKNGESIGPSWILHGLANLTCFITLSFLI